MSLLPRRLLLLVGAALSLSAAPAWAPVTASAATQIGLSDQQPATWSDARLHALGLRFARLIVPWDAATSPTESARVQAWLAATAAAGMAPHVAFEHLRTDACPGWPCTAPTRQQYRAAVDAFRARWPQVTTFTTWNEANHSSQPVADDPAIVAGYWSELTGACPSCTVVAGDVLDSGGYVDWLRRFAAAAPRTPQLWGLHNYGDVTYGRTTGTDAVLAAVPGTLWIEETGGIVTLRNSAGRVTLSTSEARAEASVDRAFQIVAARPRITRMYLYHWKANSLLDRFDAGLLRPDGTSRASYAAVARNLAVLASATPTGVMAATAPTLTARWSKGKPGQLLVRVTCPAQAADARCRGKVVLRVRTKAKRTNRSYATATLATRTYATTASRRTVTIRVTVRRSVRARIRRATVRRLALRVTPTSPANTAFTKTLAIAK